MTKRGDIDEEVVRDRRDPRREDSVPPQKRSAMNEAKPGGPGRYSERPPARHSDRAPPMTPSSPPPPMVPSAPPPQIAAPSEAEPVKPTSIPPEPTKADSIKPAAMSEPPPSFSGSKGAISVGSMPTFPVEDQRASTNRIVTNRDPRVDEVETALRRNDWDGVLRALGPADSAGRLPPNLGLIYAIARKEKETEASKGSEATELAIRCAAGLLGVTVDSPLALVVAKRIVRKNPVSWQKAPASAGLSAVFMIIALVLGGGIGWLVATGRLQVRYR